MLIPLIVINALLVVSILTNIILATLLLVRSREKNRVFLSFTAYIIALWNVVTMLFVNINDVSLLGLVAEFLYITGFIMVSAFVYSVSVFVAPERKWNKKIIVVSLATLVFFSYLIFFTDKIIAGISTDSKVIRFGPFYILYSLYITASLLLGCYYLMRRYKEVAPESRMSQWQLRYIGFGALISISCGLLFNIILPFFGIFSLYWLGPIFGTVFVAFACYAVFRHYLFNVRVIVIELFTALIILILLINILMTKTWLDLVLKTALFIGVFIFSISLIRDVINTVRSRQKIAKLARSLRRANRRLRKLDRAKSDFVSIASHQLRSPLSITKSFLSMSLEGFYGAVSRRVKDKLKKSLESNERLVRLVDDLLDLSHMEEGRMKFDFKRVSLREIIEDAYNDLKQEAKAKGLEFVFARPKKNGFFVRADVNKMRQLIHNLIDNAIKYTEKGKIELKIGRTDGKILFAIKDTGLGIAKDEQKQIFKKFIRGRKMARVWTEGMGLGLYVAKLIVEAHKGRIGVKSKGEGKGSEFWVKLPRARRNKQGVSER